MGTIVDDDRTNGFVARAAIGSYFALTGIWFVLALFYMGIAQNRHDAEPLAVCLLLIVIGLLFGIWLRGFRLRLTSSGCEYRDGFYRSTSIPLKSISCVKHVWIELKYPGWTAKVPRLVIMYGDNSDSVAINTKPFSKKDLAKILSAAPMVFS
jgi:hypothetical protein